MPELPAADLRAAVLNYVSRTHIGVPLAAREAATDLLIQRGAGLTVSGGVVLPSGQPGYLFIEEVRAAGGPDAAAFAAPAPLMKSDATSRLGAVNAGVPVAKAEKLARRPSAVDRLAAANGDPAPTLRGQNLTPVEGAN